MLKLKSMPTSNFHSIRLHDPWVIQIHIHVQSTLVISNSKGLSETLRDICTSTYQIFRIEEKIIQTSTFNKFICNWTLEVRDISKILWKRGEIAPQEPSLLFPQYFLLVVRFSCLGRDKIFTSRQAVIQDKRVWDNKSQLYLTQKVQTKISCFLRRPSGAYPDSAGPGLNLYIRTP